MTEELTEELSESVKKKSRESIQYLYNNQSSVYNTLDGLDRSYKSGEEIEETIEFLLTRFEALTTFFEYMIRNDLRRSMLMRALDLVETEEARFVESLASKYSSLVEPIKEYTYIRAGIVNYLHRFSKEGFSYDLDNQAILIQFSLHSRTKRFVRMKNLIDDVVWLSSSLLEVSTDAIKICAENKNILSPALVRNLRSRLNDATKILQNFEAAINNYPYLVSSTDKSIVSHKQQAAVDNQTNVEDSTPVVDLSDTE